MLFAYFGPDVMLPVASVIAAVAGVVLMLGHNVAAFSRKVVRRIWPFSKKQ
jgi:hypothetical protein